MKGKIELFYALPNIGAYLEKKGIPEQHLKPLIQMLVEGAAEYHLKENLENLEGVIGHYLQSMHCKVLVELDEHILDRTIEHLAKRKKK